MFVPLLGLFGILLAVNPSVKAPDRASEVERLFSASLTGPKTYKIERTLMREIASEPSLKTNTLSAWCADSCLLGSGGLRKPSEAYATSLAHAEAAFSKEAERIFADPKYIDGNSRSLALIEALHRTFAEAGVYNALRAYIAMDLMTSNSCVNDCVEGSSHGYRPDANNPPWKKVLMACTANDEDLSSHIVMHPSEPSVPEGYRKAAESLLDNHPFSECLRSSIQRVPALEELVKKLYPGGDSENLGNVRQGVWKLWEVIGVNRIVDEAAKDKPDQAQITRWIQACIAGQPLAGGGGTAPSKAGK